MRISLLLEREPFGAILEATLSRFLKLRSGDDYEVKWYSHRPAINDLRQQGQQPWICNIYLNAIFGLNAKPQIFAPIRREFGQSLHWWLRPMQSAYVTLALRQPTAQWLAQASVGISPPLAEADNLLIVAGNHKLRLLNQPERQVFGMLKNGFRSDFMRREIEARQEAQALGVPVPKLHSIAEDKTWFSEQYLSGTPINRLAGEDISRQAAVKAAHDLRRLLAHSAVDSDLREYTGALSGQIMQLVQAQHLLTTATKQNLAAIVDRILTEINDLDRAGSTQFVTALTHGDFQSANILVNNAGYWLIDWEYSQRRQILYDALVFGLMARYPHGLADRVRRYPHTAPDTLEAILWPDAEQSAAARRLRVLVFLLEELELQLTENANICFTQAGGGLIALMAALNQLMNGTGRRE